MRIDLVITELDAGGAERCLAELAAFLHHREHQIRVISVAPLPQHGNPIIERLHDVNIHPLSLSSSHAVHLPRAIARLRKLWQQDSPDIVQSFLFHANVICSLSTLGKQISTRAKWAAGIRVLDPRKSREWIERWALRRADATICVSQSIARSYQMRHMASAEKIFVVPNGIIFDSVPPADWSELNLPRDVDIILFVGRLHLQKGVDQLPRIAKRIFQALPDHHLVVMGNGPLSDSLPLEAQKLLSEIQLERFHLIPWRADARRWIAGCSIFLLPSRWEGMPNVLLEAMAAGKPIVSTKAEGVIELLGPAADQQVVELNDWDGLADRVISLAQSPTKRDAIGKENHERAREFELPKVLQRYEEIYTNLLTSRKEK